MLLRQAQEKKYGTKFDGTPCALELQPDALEKKGKQPPVFLELLGEEGGIHSLLRQANSQNKEYHEPSNNTAAPCALDALKLRVEDAETDLVSGIRM